MFRISYENLARDVHGCHDIPLTSDPACGGDGVSSIAYKVKEWLLPVQNAPHQGESIPSWEEKSETVID
jgi:hypothetical protein